jgi:O-antigen/teichoic acid export membrane protein
MRSWLRKAVRRTPLGYGALLTLARMLPVGVLVAVSQMVEADTFGKLAIVVTALNVATLLTDAGTDNAAGALASAAEDQAAQDRVLATLVYSRLGISLVATSVLVLPQLYAISSVAAATLLGIAALVANGLAAFNAAKRIRLRVNGGGEPKQFLREKLVIAIGFVVGIAVLPRTTEGMVTAFLAASIVGPLVTLQPLTLHRARPRARDMRQLLAYAAPFILTTALAAITWRVATFILSAHGEYEQAGYLALAYYPVQAFSTVPNLAAPLLLVRRHAEALSARVTAEAAALMGTVIAAVILAATFVLPGLTNDVMNGSDGVATLRYLALGMPFLWVNPILVTHIRQTQGAWRPVIVPLFTGFGALAASVALVPSQGAPGAAAIITAAEAIAAWLLVVMVLRRPQPRRTRAGAGAERVGAAQR